jgi:DNA-binding NarL/FixJ family response regulator
MNARAEGRPCRVGIFDDRALTRQCLAHYLKESGRDVAVVTVVPIDQARRAFDLDDTIDVAVMNIGGDTVMRPGVKAAFESLRSLRASRPVVVVGDREDRDAVVLALRQGASAYVPTSLDPRLLVEALHFVQNGGTFVPPSALFNSARPGETLRSDSPRVLGKVGLTSRQFEVLQRLQEGKANKAIAHELDMQEGTVKVHVRRIMKKLNATNRTEAALLGQQLMASAQPEPS